MEVKMPDKDARIATLAAEAERLRREQGKLSVYFRDEAPGDGFEGDVEGWSPVETAIAVMRRKKPRANTEAVEHEAVTAELLVEHSGCGHGIQIEQVTAKLAPGDAVYVVRGKLGQALLIPISDRIVTLYATRAEASAAVKVPSEDDLIATCKAAVDTDGEPLQMSFKGWDKAKGYRFLASSILAALNTSPKRVNEIVESEHDALTTEPAAPRPFAKLLLDPETLRQQIENDPDEYEGAGSAAMEPEGNDETCTCCHGTGWNDNMERYCDCEDGLAQRPVAPQEAEAREPDAPKARRLAEMAMDFLHHDADTDTYERHVSALTRKFARLTRGPADPASPPAPAVTEAQIEAAEKAWSEADGHFHRKLRAALTAAQEAR
jgi:hypothetical protein